MDASSADALRRWVALHRRPMAAGCAFVAVLLALSALTAPAAPPASGPADVLAVPEGRLAVPLRLDDAAVASLLHPGDRIDVFAADPRAGAEIVASGVIVGARPSADDGPWADGDGLVLVHATPEQAFALAAASAAGHIAVAVHPE